MGPALAAQLTRQIPGLLDHLATVAASR